MNQDESWIVQVFLPGKVRGFTMAPNQCILSLHWLIHSLEEGFLGWLEVVLLYNSPPPPRYVILSFVIKTSIKVKYNLNKKPTNTIFVIILKRNANFAWLTCMIFCRMAGSEMYPIMLFRTWRVNSLKATKIITVSSTVRQERL